MVNRLTDYVNSFMHTAHLIVEAKKPRAGIPSRKDNQFGGEAWKNQAAFGRTGNRPGVPPKPSEKPNGSFHKPKPHVPRRFAAEALMRKFRVQGGAWGKRLRERAA